jgi:hypothetical protein
MFSKLLRPADQSATPLDDWLTIQKIAAKRRTSIDKIKMEWRRS